MDDRNTPSIFATQTDVVWLYLLKLVMTGTPADGGPSTLRLVNNSEAIISKCEDGITAQTYEPFPFELILPQDDADTLPSAKIRFANFADGLVQAIRGWITPPKVTLYVVTHNYPDVVEKELANLTLRNVSYDSLSINGSLEVNNILTRRFPKDRYDPVFFPGLFR